MNILEIYKQYKIMPQLQEHMLRVAGVAAVICKHITRGKDAELLHPQNHAEIDTENIILACLLHDMGNIIKFDLSKAKSLVNENLDISYWEQVRQSMIQKYGKDEHHAHKAIAAEIGVSERVVELIDSISFLGAPKNAVDADFGKKICQYADDRVGPFGVVTLEQRLADLRKRYDHHSQNSPERDAFEQALREIEKQIFEKCKIKPEDIADERVKGEMMGLKGFEI